MSLLGRLERRLGQFAIKQLMTYIIGLNLLVYLLTLAYPESSAPGLLYLEPRLILQGEVWRVVTFVLIPPAASILWIAFILYFYYIIWWAPGWSMSGGASGSMPTTSPACLGPLWLPS